MERPIKRSVALVARRRGDPHRLLLVRRPQTPGEELPGLWGLPAASLGPGETEEQAARRAARDKLGCEVRLLRLLARGVQDRPGYRLQMAVYEAELTGTPRLPAPPHRAPVTYYVDWRFGRPEDLREAAVRGSLCARLALDALRPQRGPYGSRSSAANRRAE